MIGLFIATCEIENGHLYEESEAILYPHFLRNSQLHHKCYQLLKFIIYHLSIKIQGSNQKVMNICQ